MLRFLKWIFLIFGGLGLVIMSFFYVQNRTDLHLYFDNKNTLDYSYLKETCKDIDNSYYFDCFYNNFDVYLEKVSLTGISLGLKTAFSFSDRDKLSNTLYGENEKENDIRFALNHLLVNNLALDNSTKRFHGFDFTYGGYIGKVKDFLDRGMAFSDGIITGLKGADGIKALGDTEQANAFSLELKSVEEKYRSIQLAINAWLSAEISALKEKHKVE